MPEPAARCVGATAEPRPATEGQQKVSQQRHRQNAVPVLPGNGIQAPQAARPPPPSPDLPRLPWGPRTCTSRAEAHPARKEPRWAGLQGQGLTKRAELREGRGKRVRAELQMEQRRGSSGEELQGCGAGLRRGGGATDSAPPCSVSGTHLWVGGSCKALSHARWAASAEPLPPASGHTNSQALAAEQPLFSLLVNQAKECFLHRAVLVQLDLDLHRQGLWLVPALYGWSRRF